MDRVNEGTTWITTVTFTDENGDPATPTSASYRIDDVGNNLEVRPDTDITGLSSAVDLMWTEADTQIIDPNNPYETRRMTVTWSYGDPTGHGTEEYLLQVKNMRNFAVPSPA